MLNSVSFASNWTPFIPTLGAIVSIFLTLPAVYLVEKCGRKKLLLSTLTICAVANFLLTIFALVSQHYGQRSWASLAFIVSFFIYGVGYNLGVGPVAYFIPGELVPPQALSIAMGSAVSVNWLSIMLTTLIYYPLNQLVGGWSFLMFAIPTTFAIVYLNHVLPSLPSQNYRPKLGDNNTASSSSNI